LTQARWTEGVLSKFPNLEAFFQKADHAAAKVTQLEEGIRGLRRVKEVLSELAQTC